MRCHHAIFSIARLSLVFYWILVGEILRWWNPNSPPQCALRDVSIGIKFISRLTQSFLPIVAVTTAVLLFYLCDISRRGKKMWKVKHFVAGNDITQWKFFSFTFFFLWKYQQKGLRVTGAICSQCSSASAGDIDFDINDSRGLGAEPEWRPRLWKRNSLEGSRRETIPAGTICLSCISLFYRLQACVCFTSPEATTSWQSHSGTLQSVFQLTFTVPPRTIRSESIPRGGSPAMSCLDSGAAAPVTFHKLVSSEESHVNAPRPAALCLSKAVARFIYRRKWVRCSCTLRPSL